MRYKKVFLLAQALLFFSLQVCVHGGNVSIQAHYTSPVNKTVVFKNALVVTCNVTADTSVDQNQIKIKWKKEGISITAVSTLNNRFKLSNQGLTYSLTISKGNNNDVGNWSCHVLLEGQEQDSSPINVVTTIAVKIKTENINVVEEKKLRIECSVLGNPYPALSWRIQTYNYNVTDTDPDFDRERVKIQDYTDDSSKLVENGILIIEKVNKSDRGLYFCIGTNRYYKGNREESQSMIRVKGNYVVAIQVALTFQKFSRKACPVGLNLSEDSIQISDDKIEHHLKLYPYTNYIFKLTVYGSDHLGDSEEIHLTTKYEETFSEEEIPTIERIEPDQAGFKVVFKYLNCSVLKGELLLNYRAIGVEDWCESVSLRENLLFKFPFENSRMVISSLTPYCTYNVTIFISRTGNDWKNARHLTPFMEKTKSDDLLPKPNGNSANSNSNKGPGNSHGNANGHGYGNGNKGNGNKGNHNKNKDETDQTPSPVIAVTMTPRGPEPDVCQPSVTTVKGQTSCKGHLIFNSQFNRFFEDREKFWTVQRKFASAPDYEFVVYEDNPRTLSVYDGHLVITPILTDQIYGDGYVTHSTGLDLGEQCTGVRGSAECYQKPEGWYIIPPVVSSQISTQGKFLFKYGKMEIRAKLPKGDWLYPELYLNPETQEYGPNYESRQIRIAFAPGNQRSNQNLEGGLILGHQPAARKYAIKSVEKNSPWADEFHNFTVLWTPASITLSVDNSVYGSIFPPQGGFSSLASNLQLKNSERWKTGGPLAPFDKEMHIVIGVGAGGHNFEDRADGTKPWVNNKPISQKNFYKARNTWLPTWGNEAKLDVQHVKVWALE